MIILDFIKTDTQINGKTIKSKYIVRQIPKNTHNEERECMLNAKMQNICALYNLEGQDRQYKDTIGCNSWRDGINCMLDPTCSKQSMHGKAEKMPVLFHLQKSKFPKVALLVNMPRILLEQNSDRSHWQLQNIFMASVDREIERIYRAYLNGEIKA